MLAMKKGEKTVSSPSQPKNSGSKGEKSAPKKEGRKVKIVTPPKPKWKSRHSLKSGHSFQVGRSALQSLQPHASNPKLLVGSGSPRTTSIGKTAKKEKGTQTEASESSIDYRMCTEGAAPPEYWKVLAEQRRLALAETLAENEELHTEVEQLRSKVTELEDQVQYFSMMYQLASDTST